MKAAVGRESKACEEMEMRDLRNHRHLQQNICLETSGTTVKSHGCHMYLWTKGTKKWNVQKKVKAWSAISTTTEATIGPVDCICSLTICGEETTKYNKKMCVLYI